MIGFEERVYLTDERDDLLILPVNVKEGELTQKVTLLVTTQDRTTTGILHNYWPIALLCFLTLQLEKIM